MSSATVIRSNLDIYRAPPREDTTLTDKTALLFKISQMACARLDEPTPDKMVPDDLVR